MNFSGTGLPRLAVEVPGRVNLIGEHIDYHGLPVLPMAIDRRIRIVYSVREDQEIRASSSFHAGECVTSLSDREPEALGTWCNYVRAASRTAQSHCTLSRGIDALVTSDLPEAAGLSSSSALLTAFTLALLHANGFNPSIAELMGVLPDGEQFVGTRGGGMDHAAVLGAHSGSALLVQFDPLDLKPISIPAGWRFLVAHSMERAEKSTALRSEYNRRRQAGLDALRTLGLRSYAAAKELGGQLDLSRLDNQEERDAFLHVVSESERVDAAVAALRDQDFAAFGTLLLQSHASLRNRLRVSTPALDALVESAMEAGAAGARLTGAGFGGCAVILCTESDATRIRQHLIASFYSKFPDFRSEDHLFVATPSSGALVG